MAESNVTLNAGSGGSDVATMTDGSGYHHQKVVIGFDGGTSPTPVDSSNPLPVGDAGGSLTVDNAGLTELAAAINASSQVDVNIAASNASVAVTNAGITTIAGAVSGTEMQVDVVAALPAGTNNIGDVDVLSVVPGTGATSLGKAVDSAAGGTDTGVALLAIRDDSLTTLTPVDGDYVPLRVSSTGALHVTGGAGGTSSTDDAAFTAASGSGTPIMGFASADAVDSGDVGVVAMTTARALHVHVASYATSQTDDAAFTPGTSLVSVVGAEFDDTTPDSVDEGDAGALRMSANRNLYSTIRDAAGNERGANVNASGQLSVTGPVTNVGTFAVQVDGAALTALQLIDDSVFTDDAAYTLGTSKGVMMMGFAGTQSVDANDAAALACTTAGALHTAIQSLPASTNTLEVVGDVAHDAAAAGNPVQTGGYATNNVEGVTQVAAGDLTRTVHDLNGVQVVRPHTTLEEIQSVRTTNTDGASTSLVAAAGAGVHNYLSTITVWNSSATDGYIDLRDGTAGSVLYTVPAPQTGGATISFPVPLKFGDNTAIAFDPSGAISTLYISAVFFQAQG